MGWPKAQVYVPGLDVTFRWGRGDGFMLVLRGKRAFSDEGPVVARPPVDSGGWVDNRDLHTVIDRYVREHYADWHRGNGPIAPAANAM
ncbi:MAG TPA: hypothetical protein VG317_16555 [Pseudonocardiaceae bacterium]|nr:hypothetical protein [Pseudonocardiaceae bacterium]